MTIESDNAREEIREIIEKCNKCGMCKSSCPVFNILREEQYSPRGKIILLENNEYSNVFYADTLSKNPDFKCPLKIKISDAIIQARKVIAMQNKAPKEVKELIKNLEKTGNIFGIKNPEKSK
jgi:glycolate oxidase iron-sulfur subunit